MNGVIALLGSGERSPGMKRVHRALLERRPAGRAVVVDTPYAFQVNREQMTERLRTFFRTGFARELEAVRFARGDVDSPDAVAALRRSLARADYVFAGPGSPTYARELWTSAGIADDLAGVLERGGALCLASAATLTVGRYTAPIYEVYKAGAEPHWLDGLDLLSRYGLRCAVIPHFDNAEGEGYDTRYCYLGAPRLALLEEALPEDVAVLGIDEHTALVLDLEASTLEVVGRSGVEWRTPEGVRRLESGTRLRLDELANAPLTPRAPAPPTDDPPAPTADEADAGTSAPEDDALIAAVVLARHGERERGDFARADALRDLLARSGVVLHDAPDGTTWSRIPAP